MADYTYGEDHLLCISMDVFLLSIFNILLLGIYVLESNNFDF